MKLENKKEQLKQIKKLLINIDMINGFIKEGPLASKSIERIVPKLKQVIELYLNDEASAVFFIRDSHTSNALEFKTFGVHCLENSKESELIEELKMYEKDSLTYLKNSTNFVFAKNFIADLEKLNNLKEVLVTGCLTDFCVKNGAITLKNYFDEHNKNIDVIVCCDLTDTFNSNTHILEEESKHAFNDMKNNGIKILKRFGE